MLIKKPVLKSVISVNATIYFAMLTANMLYDVTVRFERFFYVLI